MVNQFNIGQMLSMIFFFEDWFGSVDKYTNADLIMADWYYAFI